MSRFARFGVIAVFGLSGWAASAALVAAPVVACVISPGTPTCAPDPLTVNPSSTLVASTGGTVTSPPCPDNPSGPPCITANWQENVYSDPTNTFCAGCLDWLVQVTNTTASNDIVARVTVSNFSNFLTDVGFDTIAPPAGSPGFTTGTQMPNNVSRSASGSVLGWDFNMTANEIMVGQTSILLEVMTNATRVVPGTISIQNGEAVGAPALGPAVPDTMWVPALGLLGGSVLGGAAIRRRRRG